jgi:hypothetical protein
MLGHKPIHWSLNKTNQRMSEVTTYILRFMDIRHRKTSQRHDIPRKLVNSEKSKRILSKVTVDKYLHMITSAHKYTDRQTPARRRPALS